MNDRYDLLMRNPATAEDEEADSQAQPSGLPYIPDPVGPADPEVIELPQQDPELADIPDLVDEPSLNGSDMSMATPAKPAAEILPSLRSMLYGLSPIDSLDNMPMNLNNMGGGPSSYTNLSREADDVISMLDTSEREINTSIGKSINPL